MRFEESVPLDEIVPPERSEKLHPYENEDDESWEEFTESVGEEPNKPLEVFDNEDGEYELIDGDRRYRALVENEAETVQCFVLEPGDDISSEEDTTLRMITANEHREQSDPKQRARAIAQLCAPWLLPPGERESDTVRMTQTEVSSEVGKAQPTISVWLQPLRDENPLRNALAGKSSGRNPDEDDTETIDETVDYLKRGGDEGNSVIPIGQEVFVANEIGDMLGVGLNEIASVSEKAANEGWNDNRFLKYIKDNYAYDETERVDDDIEEGMLDGSDLSFEDETVQDPYDNDLDDQNADGEPEEEVDFGGMEIDVEWSDHVSDEDLNGQSLSELETRRLMTQSIEDDAAVAIHILCAKTGMSQRDIMQKFVEPLIVDNAVGWLND